MREEHIFLIGFMGSGKTSVGVLLGPALSLPFVDLDEVIVSAEGRSITSMFAADGEARFREVEARVLGDLLDSPPAVMSLGGGAFVPPDNRRRIRERGVCIWLKVSLEEALERCRGDVDRPLALDEETFSGLYERRQSVYRRCDVHIETDRKTPETICHEIMLRLEGKENALD